MVFNVQPHPLVPSFKQCVTFGFFETKKEQMVYAIFITSFYHIIPLTIIVISYTTIIIELTKKSREAASMYLIFFLELLYKFTTNVFQTWPGASEAGRR